jgi:hypothetical protein
MTSASTSTGASASSIGGSDGTTSARTSVGTSPSSVCGSDRTTSANTSTSASTRVLVLAPAAVSAAVMRRLVLVLVLVLLGLPFIRLFPLFLFSSFSFLFPSSF